MRRSVVGLWLRILPMMAMSPGLRIGMSGCPTQAQKHSLLIGPLKMQGAVSRSQLRAPRKASVRQLPRSPKPRRRSPFGPSPRGFFSESAAGSQASHCCL